MSKHITSHDDFEEALATHVDGWSIVKCSTPWCGPCKAIAPVFDALCQEHPDIQGISVDIDEVPEVGEDYGIRALPTFLAIKDMSVLRRLEGANKARLTALFEDPDAYPD